LYKVISVWPADTPKTEILVIKQLSLLFINLVDPEPLPPVNINAILLPALNGDILLKIIGTWLFL